MLDPSSESGLQYFPSSVGIFCFFRSEAPANWTLHGGTVTLNSASPWQAPLIDPALLDTKFDIVTIREAIKAARRFAASPGWDGYIIGPFGDLATAKTDAELEAYARQNADRLPPPGRGDGGDGSEVFFNCRRRSALGGQGSHWLTCCRCKRISVYSYLASAGCGLCIC